MGAEVVEESIEHIEEVVNDSINELVESIGEVIVGGLCENEEIIKLMIDSRNHKRAPGAVAFVNRCNYVPGVRSE